jgi:hypothetical protein
MSNHHPETIHLDLSESPANPATPAPDDLLVVEVPSEIHGGISGAVVCKLVRLFRDQEY